MRLVRMGLRLPASRLLGRPYSCNVKITERCNLRCSFCGLWRLGRKDQEMTAAEHQQLARDLAALGLARVVVTGGEPLLRPDLLEIVRGYARAGPSVTLLTNGQLLDRDLLHELRQVGLQDLGVSLDTLDEAVQDERCGGTGVTRKALEALTLGVELLPKGLVEMLVTVTPENLAELPALVEQAAAIGAGVVINPVNLPAGEGEDRILSSSASPGRPLFEAAEVDAVYDRLLEMKRQGLPLLVSDRFLEESRWYLKTGDYAWRCDAGRLYFTIFSDGRLAPCSDLPALLSVRDAGWVEKFRSRAFREAAAEAAEACPGCIFSCWREVSYLVHDTDTLKERILQTLPGMRRNRR